ncbi:MAG TPA: DNA mismatch repair endonuclease MutL [Dehalococcoidia bacterium]|nr:DNA mismatch repair endonuclease MutL [Dehalococcoidia bacterium]
MSIKILDDKTISRIAAGEVVERPASVVKELVENALDAGASRIEVEVKGGGTSYIRVTDDGSGIPVDEIELAFQRHATSKLNDFHDLSAIGSLGFRGEALPSIVAVAEVEVLTCAEGEWAGSYLVLEDGVITQKKGRARNRGTTVTVRELFRRIPARLKFLKSPTTENGHIANVVSQYALAYPEVGFTLTTDGKASLRTTGKGVLIDAILDVYGKDVAARMLPVAKPDESWQGGTVASEIRVDGMVGSPELGRSGRGYLSFFVNRRWVSSRLLSYAIEEAYHGLLMTGKHPVAVLNITLPAAEVDVNIHPAKSEVKFRDDSSVFRTVQRAVRRALVTQAPVPGIEEAVATYRASSSRQQLAWTIPMTAGRKETTPPAVQPSLTDSLPLLRVVGQVFNSYIVAEGPDGLYIIDQHAAHERIRFEEVQRQRRGKMEVQGLLEPATFEVTPRHDGLMKSCLDELAGFGFSLEEFGDRTYVVRAVPALVATDNWQAMLRELMEELAGEAKSRREEKIMMSIACHGAVRSGQTLSIDEMRELVRQLERCASPHTCPHGRPTIIRLSSGQLEKEFGRT